MHACGRQRRHASSCGHALQGANTPFIMKSRGLSRAVPMSEMLERNPQIKHLMEAGELVPDVRNAPLRSIATCLCAAATGYLRLHRMDFWNRLFVESAV